jgi:hypothetical protein
MKEEAKRVSLLIYFQLGITSFTPNFGQKKREKKSYPDPGVAGPVIITPLPVHFLISSILGMTSATSFPEESST